MRPTNIVSRTLGLTVKYDTLDLDTSDIWAYEFALTQDTDDHSLYDALIQTIEPIIAQKCIPFLLETEATDKNKYAISYSGNYQRRQTDYFMWEGDYFEYKEPLIVMYKEYGVKTFAFLFALKLRQYHDNLISLDSFLYHQLATNFNSDKVEFFIFLKGLLIQHEDFLEPKLAKKIAQWKEDFKPFAGMYSGKHSVLNDPTCWSSIEVIRGEEHVRAYFSFLYKERTDAGRPFLEKEEFDLLFRYGLKVPPIPLPKKLKLHTTPKYRKSIVESCTYLFYHRYSSNLKNKIPFLQFLAYQLEDFSHVKEEKDFKNWGKNFTKKKLVIDLPFDIRNYFELAKS